MSTGGYFWCTRHAGVERREHACAARHLLGPYDSVPEAERALQRAQERTEAWDAADEQWDGEDD